MIRRVLASLVALVMIGAGIGLGGPSHPNQALASSHVVRSLSDETVEPGGRVTVTITASQYGDYAELMETLPEGFSFVSSDQPANVLVITESGRQVRIILLGPSRTVSYTMSASHVAGRHTISGLFRDEAKLESTVVGDDTVEVLGDAGTQTEPSRDVADDVANGEGDDVADDVADGEGDDVADDVADGEGDDVADDVAHGEGDGEGDDVADGEGDDVADDVANGEGDDVADNVADGEGDGEGDDVADDVADGEGDDVADGEGDDVAGDVADGEGNGEGDTRGEDGVETEGEDGVETGDGEGEAELVELEESEQGDSDMTDGTDGTNGGLSVGEVTEDEDAQGDREDGDAEEDEEPDVVWTTAGTGGRADVLPSPGTPTPALGAAAGEEFPWWLMLLLGVGGAIELALIITVVRTRMWLVLRV